MKAGGSRLAAYVGKGNRLRDMNAVFHKLLPGEAVLADRTALLELIMHRASGVVLYDRGRRLAAAALVPGPDEARGGTKACLDRVVGTSLALLRRILNRGSRPEDLEVFALGAGLPLEAGRFRGLRTALACGLPALPRVLRAEFDVALGRIVLEEDELPRAPGPWNRMSQGAI